MTAPGELDIEYVDARRVLLDALVAIGPQIGAVTLIGAQAVYLRTVDRLAEYQPYTTDADLVLDPGQLTDLPTLGDAMRNAGFVLTDEPGIWEARFDRQGADEQIAVPVDLIVPQSIASTAGRRSARLPGGHGKNTARKSTGVEGALVDRSPIEISSLDVGDARRIVVDVAGEAALLVAKLHKLGDRLARPDRLQPKDAGDVYRLFDVVDPDEMAARLQILLADDRSAATTQQAIAFGNVIFDGPNSVGVDLASRALRTALPAVTVEAIVVAYWSALRSALR